MNSQSLSLAANLLHRTNLMRQVRLFNVVPAEEYIDLALHPVTEEEKKGYREFVGYCERMHGTDPGTLDSFAKATRRLKLAFASIEERVSSNRNAVRNTAREEGEKQEIEKEKVRERGSRVRTDSNSKHSTLS